MWTGQSIMQQRPTIGSVGPQSICSGCVEREFAFRHPAVDHFRPFPYADHRAERTRFPAFTQLGRDAGATPTVSATSCHSEHRGSAKQQSHLQCLERLRIQRETEDPAGRCFAKGQIQQFANSRRLKQQGIFKRFTLLPGSLDVQVRILS